MASRSQSISWELLAQFESYLGESDVCYDVRDFGRLMAMVRRHCALRVCS